MTGAESWYVAISRARISALVVTDDAERLPEAIREGMGVPSVLESFTKDRSKERGVDLGPKPGEGLTQEHDLQLGTGLEWSR